MTLINYACVMVVFASLASAQTPPTQSAPPDREIAKRERAKQHELANQTLHDAAIANGGAISVSVDPHTDDFNAGGDLQVLGNSSERVLIGRVTKSTPRISDDGRLVVTYHTVRVSETLKGDTAQQVIVKVVGGLFRFEDGASARVDTDGFALRPGGEYMFFLNPITGRRAEAFDKRGESVQDSAWAEGGI